MAVSVRHQYLSDINRASAGVDRGGVEIRELRYVVALAEELHFGKAAERLQTAQSPLSRAIARLERRRGVTLLERTSRRVTLTDAGTVLLSEARAVLSAVTVAERRTRQAGQNRPRLVLAVKSGTAGDLLSKLLDAYQAEPGAATVEVLLRGASTPGTAARGKGRCGSSAPAVRLGAWTRHRKSVHRRTGGGSARSPPPCRPHSPSGGRSHRVAGPPDGPLARLRWRYPEGPGAEVKNLTQLFQLVALGRGTVIVPESAVVDLRPGSRRRAGSGRAAGDNGDRLAAAESASRGRRPDRRGNTSLTNRPRPRRSIDECNTRRRQDEGPEQLLRGGTRKRALPLRLGVRKHIRHNASTST